MATRTTMADAAAEGSAGLYALAAFASPSFPVGAFSYSHGLEAAIAAGDIADDATLGAWIADVLAHGAGWTDAVLLAQAHAASTDAAALAELSDLALALAPTSERWTESAAQGDAFRRAAAAWGATPPWPAAPQPCAYPVAFGAAAAAHGAPAGLAAQFFLQGFASALISVGIRLIPIGQQAGQRLLASLAPAIADLATRAANADLDDVGGAAFRSDLAAMAHETLLTRLFRS